MAVIDARTWMEHLSPDACWELLRATPVGRVVVTSPHGPEVFPVNFVVDGRSVAFKTAPGSKLRGLHQSAATCFEADAFDPDTHAGWSVMVKGRAQEVVSGEESARLASLPLTLWTAGAKDRWVRIQATEVTGRRIGPRDSDT